MSSSRYSDDEVVEILQNVDRLVGENVPITEICRRQGISRSSLYRWQRRYGIRPRKPPERDYSAARFHSRSNRVERLERELHDRHVQIEALRVVAEGN